jgi:glutathione S-transferase
VQTYAAAIGSNDPASVRAKVPLLEHGETLMAESADVTRYIAQNIGDDDKMYPLHDEAIRDKIDRFLEVFERVNSAYYGLLCAPNEESVGPAKEAFCESLRLLEDNLSQTNGGDFVLGETFSVAECMVAPWLQRFCVALPFFRGVDFDSLLSKEESAVKRWSRAVLARQSVIATGAGEDSIIASSKRFFVKHVSPGAPGAEIKDESDNKK